MSRKYLILFVIAISSLLVDQIIKKWIISTVRFGGHKTVFTSSYFEFYFTNVHNKGAAFSLFSGMPIEFFIIVSFIAILIILYFFSKVGEEQKTLVIALSLVLGGAAGNLADRIQYGYVVDYVGTLYIIGNFPGYSYLPEFLKNLIHTRIGGPPFNFADVSISIGVITLIYKMVIKGEEFKGMKVISEEPPKEESVVQEQIPSDNQQPLELQASSNEERVSN